MNFAVLLAAMIAVESGGNDRAIGDHGRARGALQIHRIVVEDVNRIAGTHYRWEDMHRRDVAVYVMTVYLTHYVTEERLGHKPTAEDFARTWNGGTSGWREPATKRYWRRVQLKLKEQ